MSDHLGQQPQTHRPALDAVGLGRCERQMVHDYAEIDDAQIYAILRTRLGDLDGYADAIVAYPQKE